MANNIKQPDLPKKKCDKCSKEVFVLKGLDAQTKVKLRHKGRAALADGKFCYDCLKEILNDAYSTVLERKVRIEFDKKKTETWEGRINYLKEGQQALLNKDKVKAIQNYLSYLKLIETVLEIEAGELQPLHFRNAQGEKEKNVIIGVYFDLIKLYDKSSNGFDKFQQAIEKFVLFAPFCKEGKKFTRLLSKYCKSKESKNKKEIKNALKELKKYFGPLATGVNGGCFIATAVYGSSDLYQVKMLRHFRDSLLNNFLLGKLFVRFYYQYSPKIALKLAANTHCSFFVRKILDIFVYSYNKLLKFL